MKIHIHVSSSAILGGTIYALTHSVHMAVSAFVSGILIDLDHLFDFFVFSGEKFSIKNFFSWCYQARWEKVTLLFHSYELYLILGIIAFLYPNDLLVGFVLGGGSHLILDQIGNRGYGFRFPLFYFLTFRYSVGFQKSKLTVRPSHRDKQ
jgi:hypothetical protein